MHPGVTFYDDHDVLLKSDVEKQLKKYQEWASESWEEMLEYYNGDEKSAKEWYDQCQAMLAEYQKLLVTAPETFEQQPTDFTYHVDLGYYYKWYPEIVWSMEYYGDSPDDYNVTQY